MPEKIENAVQPKGWSACLPRACYKTLEKTEIAEDWFEVYKLPHEVYALYEPGHFQEVISFLIVGSDKSILFDTGMGIGNIKKAVTQLTDTEVLVVNSHCHFDHVGDNHRFHWIGVYDCDRAVRRLQQGYSKYELNYHLQGDSVCKPYPEGFDPKNYTILPVEPVRLHDGQLMDLGNRQLKILHTPGHSEDSIMLLEEDTGILFTGDTFYPAALYAHFDDPFYGQSDLKTYLSTMERLAQLPGLQYLYCSHNEPVVSPKMLKEAAKGFEAVINKTHPYKIDEEGLRRYDFEGFAVITKKQDE